MTIARWPNVATGPLGERMAKFLENYPKADQIYITSGRDGDHGAVSHHYGLSYGGSPTAALDIGAGGVGAGDVAMRDFAKWLYDNYADFTVELIHSTPFADDQGFYVKNQTRNPGGIVYGGPGVIGHFDHVHWATSEELMSVIEQRQGQTAPAFAQRAQGSRFPERYAQHWDEARDVLRGVPAGQPTLTRGGDMAFTGDPVWLEDVLREALGDRLVVEGDWVNRGTGGSMGELWGVMIHHTANINETVAHIRDGVQQPGGFLHGPLAQCLLTADGKCHLVAVGPCNHAGDGFYPGLGSNNGNRRLIAFECCWPTPRPDLPLGYDPHEQWSTPLVITMRDATAAVLKKLGVGSARAIGHKEYAPNRKIDPGNMDMNWFRGEVQKDLDGVIFPGERAVPQRGPIPREFAAPSVRGSDDRPPVRDLCDLLPGFGGRVVPELADRTVADRLAEIERLTTELRDQLDELRATQPGPVGNGQSGDGDGAPTKAATKRVAAKKVPGKGAAAKKSPAKKVAAET